MAMVVAAAYLHLGTVAVAVLTRAMAVAAAYLHLATVAVAVSTRAMAVAAAYLHPATVAVEAFLGQTTAAAEVCAGPTPVPHRAVLRALRR